MTPRIRPVLLASAAMLLASAAQPLRAAEEAPPADTLLQAVEVIYDENADTITANGKVEIERDGRILLADQVVYDRGRDVAMARGNVSVLEPNGTVFFFDELQVTGDLKDGIAKEVRVLLSDKSRMASRSFRRIDGKYYELNDAAYSACDICEGRDPVWQLKAGRVRYDAEEEMVYYRNAWLEMWGVPVFYTPYLAHPDPTGGSKSGLLLPIISGGRNLGLSYEQPYYINLAPDKDMTLAPLLTTGAGNGATAEYRQVFQSGELYLKGSAIGGDQDVVNDVRGHVRGFARWDMDDNWRSGADVHLASDRTYLRRYNFEAPTWLTTSAFAERFGSNSYFSANTYYFQRQRRAVVPGTTPIVAPLLTYSYVTDPGRRGGYFTVDGNSLILLREDGTDVSRLSATTGWHVPYTAPLGDIYTLRTTLRADGYYVRDAVRPSTADTFTGFDGRVVPEASLEWRMPFISGGESFTQFLEPIVMGVVSPIGQNPENIPNEDSRDLEFDTTNLFDTQKFTGFDRVEGGARVNYGLRWAAYAPGGGTLAATVGQSYRFHRDSVFAPQSGLEGHFSDFVGSVDVTPNPLLSLQYRFRVDKQSFDARRTEVSAVAGPDLFRGILSYLYVQQPDPSDPALGEREEIYGAISTKLNQHWSLAASSRHDLSPGGKRIRTAVGFTYEDECFVFGLDLADDNTADRDFRRGFAVLLRFSLKTIGDIQFNTDVGATR